MKTNIDRRESSSEQTASADSAARDSPPDLSFARVLIVDDFATNLYMAAAMMKKYKLRVDCVGSGKEALDRIQRGDPVYHAVFMDNVMPEMDGTETTRRIRLLNTEYARTIPVIAMTGDASPADEQHFLRNGFQALLPKPINPAKLASILNEWIPITSG